MNFACSDDSSSSSSSSLADEETFEWNKYLMVRNAEEVPDEFFDHVCKSEQNGIELGSVVEVENEDQCGYWFASVCSSKGVLINLHYFGDENDKHDFWLEVKSPRIHPLNWGSENNRKLIPPYSDRFSRVNPKIIKKKIEDEHILSNAVLNMKGASIYNIFKPEMFVEVQDTQYPYRVWISKILKNVGGRLLLKIEGEPSPENKPFWLFYMNDRIFPFGWAEQKGLPWRVMNLNSNSKDTIESSSLLNVLKPKTPEQHSYKVGEMLEVINPYSLMVFYVGTIVKIYDNRYFKVEVDNDSDINKRITFVATKENPHLFNAGWASQHKFSLKPPSDWTEVDTFCWSKYSSMKSATLAKVDDNCKKKLYCVHIGMKLEAVDPLNLDCIRVATVKGFANHWVLLSFDRTYWCQEILHVRSVYSDEIFPVGWCNKHKYMLTSPKLPYTDCNDYENCYYMSDIEIDFNELDETSLIKYPHYVKGDIPYHYSKKNPKSFEDNLGESIEDILNENCVESPVTNTACSTVNTNVKVELPELDEEFHDALFCEEETIGKKEVSSESVNDEIKEKIMLTINKKSLFKNSYIMSIYFNKKCNPGCYMTRKKISTLPDSLGPGPVSNILHKAITLLINLSYFPSASLKRIKNNQNTLLNGPGGVEMLITTNKTKHRSSYSDFLILPETKKMAQTFCTALSHLYEMCENFISTEKTCCVNCKTKLNPRNSKLKPIVNAAKPIMKTTKRKITGLNLPEEYLKINDKIVEVAEEHLDWTNISLVKRYKNYLAKIVQFETHLMNLNLIKTPNELNLREDIQLKKHQLRMMDGIDEYKNTKSKFRYFFENIVSNNDALLFINDWKYSFEKHYRCDPRFKTVDIDIGDFEKIQVTSNPKSWSPKDVFNYLSSDSHCKPIANMLNKEEVDGVAFMILTEEQLLNYLECPINLAIRIMCHVAEVKYICFTKYTES